MIKYILLPFAALYNAITKFRNHLYNIESKKSISFDIPVISVGNLTVGGTGKTPHVTYITSYIKDKLKKNPAILSRGYGRKSKGFFLAQNDTNSKTLGDEPLLLYHAFSGDVIVAVCEERILGIPAVLIEQPEVECIILDDAYQHRKVKPGFNILLSDFNRPFYKDYLLPAGRLRESRTGANRADAVIVTKLPETISETELKVIEENVRKFTKAPVFFSLFEYLAPKKFSGVKKEIIKEVLLVTGIANTKYLTTYLDQHFKILRHLSYKDHVNYTQNTLEEILNNYNQLSNSNVVVLCTEKDMVKIREILPSGNQIPFYYLPISVKLLKDEANFEKLISDYILNN
ncbi:tetraacyldisaccharide 4'-kinase [Chondrinema litorale]|uniref:tetraacyldisaccharide 4'-kinase n=1 Tax=Chondrinema litorale TaxID=2994555 RepID=UPI002543B608|nr:tetraacyldisaccharide 4'-kinase [Chondrinema litorale]UZR93528.1 tetraacyldisaccharide 4'-kinase [Chondrinema litorale]